MRHYNPGCALMLYKPHLAQKLHEFLNKSENVPMHSICCHHEPRLEKGSVIINTCAGCNKRFRSLYDGIFTVPVWEILLNSDFAFPDYGGEEMAIHDPCPTRAEKSIHGAVRALAERMNIKVVEPALTRETGVCCGDSYYPAHPLESIHEKMRQRAGQMPRESVIVYCVSCIKSMHIGGKKPRYLVDLLFGERTDPGVYDTEKWHDQLSRYMDESAVFPAPLK